jgi:predicted phosphodiesterase
VGKLADEFAATAEVDDARRAKAGYPTGWEPGIRWDGDSGVIVTEPSTEQPKSFDHLLALWGLDAALYEVVEPAKFRAWDATLDGRVQRLYHFAVQVRTRRAVRADLDGLLAEIKRHKVKPRPAEGAAQSYVVALGDLQLGKVDGDGTEGTIRRVLNSIDDTALRLKELRRIRQPVDTVYLAWLGDCIEGFNSQGGRLAWRVDLPLTEQVRILRRLMLAQVKAFAPLCSRLVVVSVPGNHDEAVRTGDKMSTRYDDSWAVEAACSVGDILAENPGAYGHVAVVVPKKDELTVTLDVSGTIVGFAHGHQFKGGAQKWWAGQAHGMQPIGDATLLLAGHLHHLRVEQEGPKTFVQVPALDGGSTWWRHRTGQHSPPGVVSMLVGEGGWTDMVVV